MSYLDYYLGPSKSTKRVRTCARCGAKLTAQDGSLCKTCRKRARNNPNPTGQVVELAQTAMVLGFAGGMAGMMAGQFSR